MMRRLSSQTMVAGWCSGGVPVCVCVRAWGWIFSEIGGRSNYLKRGGSYACWAIRIAAVAAFKIQIDPARFRRVHDKQAQGRSSCRCPSRVPPPRQQAQAARASGFSFRSNQSQIPNTAGASIDRQRGAAAAGSPKRSWRGVGSRARGVAGLPVAGCAFGRGDGGRTRVRSITNAARVQKWRFQASSFKGNFSWGSLVVGKRRRAEKQPEPTEERCAGRRRLFFDRWMDAS